MSEMRVGTRELKTRLSEYMRRVKAGETIIVTEHGKTIGQIVPVKAHDRGTHPGHGGSRTSRMEWSETQALSAKGYQ